MSKELQTFEPLKLEIAKFVSPVKTLQVTDFQSSQQAIETAQKIKGYIKELDGKRRELVDPLNKQVKAVNEYVRSLEAPLLAAEAHVKNQLNAFAFEQEQRRRAEQARIEAERRKAEEELRAKQDQERVALQLSQAEDQEALSLFGVEEEVPTVEQVQVEERAQLREEFDGRKWDADQRRIKNTRMTIRCEIEDVSLVPKEFLIVTLNEKAAVAALKAGAKIPGLKVWEEANVAIGRKTRVPALALEESE
jgi:hypothetical protein